MWARETKKRERGRNYIDRATATVLQNIHTVWSVPPFTQMAWNSTKLPEWHRLLGIEYPMFVPIPHSLHFPCSTCFPSSALLKRHQIPFGYQLIKCFCGRCKFLPAGKMRHDRIYAPSPLRLQNCGYVLGLKKFM